MRNTRIQPVLQTWSLLAQIYGLRPVLESDAMFRLIEIMISEQVKDATSLLSLEC